MKKLLIITSALALFLLLATGIALFVLWRASQVVPDFYAETISADPLTRNAASDKMIQKATVLANDFQKPGRWEALFSQEEINGWLAVDLQKNHSNSLPPEIAEPRVVIEPGGLRVACRATRGSIETVLSIALDLYLAEPSVVGIRIRQVRAGAVPLPLADVLDRIRELGQRQGLRILWQQAEGDPVALVRLNPVVEGERPVVIDTLELAEGEIYLAGTTIERSGRNGKRGNGTDGDSQPQSK